MTCDKSLCRGVEVGDNKSRARGLGHNMKRDVTLEGVEESLVNPWSRRIPGADDLPRREALDGYAIVFEMLQFQSCCIGWSRSPGVKELSTWGFPRVIEFRGKPIYVVQRTQGSGLLLGSSRGHNCATKLGDYFLVQVLWTRFYVTRLAEGDFLMEAMSCRKLLSSRTPLVD